MANLRIMQPSFAAGELTPALHARVDLAKYNVGAKQLKNFFVHAHGGASNRQGTDYVATALGVTRLIPFQYNVEQAYVLEFSNLKMRVLKDGALVESGGVPLEVVSPFPTAALAELKFVQSADVMYFTHPDYAPRSLTRSSHTAWTFATVSFTPTISAPVILTTANTTAWALSVEYDAGDFVNNGGIVYKCEADHTSAAETEPDDGASWGSVWSYHSAGRYNGTGSYDIDYKISAVSAAGEESLPSATITVSADTSGDWELGKYVTLRWQAVSGADYYKVYKNPRGYYGYVGTADGTTFKDDNISPATDNGPQTAYNPFTGTGNYPGVAGIFEQRLILGRSDTAPQTIWASQTGIFNNFGTSRPLRDTDSIEAALASTQVNEIRWLVPFDELIVFTSGGEWLMTNGDNSDALTPTSVQYKVQGYRGCADVKPIVIGDTVIYVQRGGQVVRDLQYRLEVDKYAGNNLSVLSEHLFRNRRIVAWAYQQTPSSIVWAALDDGSFCSFTYLPEHEVWAWCPQETDGLVEEVASIPGDEEDEVYFVVKRNINGSDVRFVEKLHTRNFTTIENAYFVDCGLTYDGALATTISGLDHLVGETVSILADGNVSPQQVVAAGGTITLPQAASKVHVGLPYTSTLETLSVDLTAQGDTLQGKRKVINQVTLRLEDTRELWVGPDTSHLVQVPFRTDEGYEEATRLYTGDKRVTIRSSWGTDGRIVIRQSDPLPITVLAIIPEVSPGG